MSQLDPVPGLPRMRIAAVKSGTFGSSIVKIFNIGTSTMGTILQVSNNNI